MPPYLARVGWRASNLNESEGKKGGKQWHDVDLWLIWLVDVGTDAGRRDMTALLQCANADGWCAWGLPQTPGQMIGTSASVVHDCSSCPTGDLPFPGTLGQIKATHLIIPSIGDRNSIL